MKEKIKELWPECQFEVDLAPYTTFHLKSLAAAFLLVKTKTDLVTAVTKAKAHNLPYLILAGGSNLVLADKLTDRLVICYRSDLKLENIKLNNLEVMTPAGVKLADLVDQTIEAGLEGLSALAGIPGTVGGAIVGNAGAYGQTISDHLVEIEIFDGQDIKVLAKTEIAFAYRQSILKTKPWLVLSVKFLLREGDKTKLKTKAEEIIAIRNKRYPRELKCPGSFFKNILATDVSPQTLSLIPETEIIAGKIPAGYLLDQIQAKNLTCGGIKVSDWHGNLIVNTGTGTYEEVCQLADLLKQKVQAKFGILLAEEVRFVT